MSGETDVSSCSAYSGISEDEGPANVSSEMTDVLHQFNEHMERLTDDLEKEDANSQIPDLVVSKEETTGDLDVEEANFQEKIKETETSSVQQKETYLECINEVEQKEEVVAEEAATQNEDAEQLGKEDLDKTDPVFTTYVELKVASNKTNQEETSVETETSAFPEKTQISSEDVLNEVEVPENEEDETEPVQDNLEATTENKDATVPYKVEVSKNETVTVQEESEVNVEREAALAPDKAEVTVLQAVSVKAECVEVQELPSEIINTQFKDCPEQSELHVAETVLSCNGNGESEEIPFIDDVCLNGTKDNDLLLQSNDHNSNEVFEELDDVNGNRQKSVLPKSRTHKLGKSALLGEEQLA